MGANLCYAVDHDVMTDECFIYTNDNDACQPLYPSTHFDHMKVVPCQTVRALNGLRHTLVFTLDNMFIIYTDPEIRPFFNYLICFYFLYIEQYII